MNSSAALIVRNLRKEYRSPGRPPLCAVDGISFDIPKGECFGLLGPNGAGKSTSMNCITGFYPVTAGEIRLLGIDVHAEPRKARRQLGVCSQEDTLDSDFSVLDQMIRYGTYFGRKAAVVRPRAEALLERFGLMTKGHDLVESLSGGMRRRLQVARALISEPEVLILDEPTTGWIPKSGACCGTSWGNAGHKASQFFFRPTTWRRRSASAIGSRYCTTGRSWTAQRLRS